MRSSELLERIVTLNTGDKIELFDGIGIEFVSYTGLVAKSGWNATWKLKKHRDRSKLGLFDFKALLNKEPPAHRELLTEAIKLLAVEELTDIYNGGDPESYDKPKKSLLQLIQLLFLEQEVNYGDEIFQAWTKMNAPRDFFMAYLIRTLDMSPADAVRFISTVTDRRGIIRQPPEPKDTEWVPYIEALGVMFGSVGVF
jgi:hypothetical protein